MTTRCEEIQELLDEVQRKNEEQQRLDEAGAPYIGIFYVINGELRWTGEHAHLLQAINGIKDVTGTQMKFWKLMNLPYGKTKVIHDNHYKCFQCKPVR